MEGTRTCSRNCFSPTVFITTTEYILQILTTSRGILWVKFWKNQLRDKITGVNLDQEHPAWCRTSERCFSWKFQQRLAHRLPLSSTAENWLRAAWKSVRRQLRFIEESRQGTDRMLSAHWLLLIRWFPSETQSKTANNISDGSRWCSTTCEWKSRQLAEDLHQLDWIAALVFGDVCRWCSKVPNTTQVHRQVQRECRLLHYNAAPSH